MAKRRRTSTAQGEPAKAGTPRGIQYQALKGMSYRPSVRDQHRRERRDSRRALQRGQW